MFLTTRNYEREGEVMDAPKADALNRCATPRQEENVTLTDSYRTENFPTDQTNLSEFSFFTHARSRFLGKIRNSAFTVDHIYVITIVLLFLCAVVFGAETKPKTTTCDIELCDLTKFPALDCRPLAKGVGPEDAAEAVRQYTGSNAVGVRTSCEPVGVGKKN